MLVYDDGSGQALYVGSGAFGNGYNGIARWNGQAWSTVGNGTPGPVESLGVFDDDGPGPHPPELYAGGHFPGGIVRWNGTAWSVVGGGLTYNNFDPTPDVFSMAVYDDGSGSALYITGNISTAGGVPTSGIARWNGQAWSTFGPSFGQGGMAMAVFDDGAGGGPALYISGNAPSSGVLNQGIARWNGQAWSIPGGTGLTGAPSRVGRALAVYDDGQGGGPALYVGGFFTAVGGVPASNIARYGRPACLPNCDGSQSPSGCPTINVADFTCYLQRFAAGDQRANCDASTTAPTLNVADFTCFLQRFAAGCP